MAKKLGAIDRVKRLLGARPAAPIRGSKAVGQSATTIHGVILVDAAGELILQLSGDGFDWDPATVRARLRSTAGREVQLEILLDRTTRAGRVAPGLSVRLVLAIPERGGLLILHVPQADGEDCILHVTRGA